MDTKALSDTLKEGLDTYAKGKTSIRRCLPAIEKACEELIAEIDRSSSFEDAENKFDQLFQLQGILSQAVFVYGIELNSRLFSIVKAFERLHDPFIREYWYKKFKDGVSWPGTS